MHMVCGLVVRSLRRSTTQNVFEWSTIQWMVRGRWFGLLRNLRAEASRVFGRNRSKRHDLCSAPIFRSTTFYQHCARQLCNTPSVKFARAHMDMNIHLYRAADGRSYSLARHGVFFFRFSKWWHKKPSIDRDDCIHIPQRTVAFEMRQAAVAEAIYGTS